MRARGRMAAPLVAVGLLVAQPSWAWDADDRFNDAAKAVNGVATTPAGQERVAARLARELNASWGQPAYSAASLSAQRAQTGWGWGELLIADRLAQTISRKDGISLAQATAQVTAARQQGMGRGLIARAHDLKLGGGLNGVQSSAKSIEKAAKAADKLEDKTEKASGKPGKAVDQAEDKAEKAADRSGKASDKGGGQGGGGGLGGGGGQGEAGHGGGHGGGKG